MLHATSAETGIMHACKKTKAFANRRSIKRLGWLIFIHSQHEWLTSLADDRF